MAAATATPEAIPEPIPDRSDITKAKRIVFLDRIAHTGMMLEKMMRQNRLVEGIQRFAATGNVKDLEIPEGEDDGMGVNIGNENHYHQTTASPATPATGSPLTTLALAASMLCGGAGLGYIVNDLLKPQPAAPPATTDTDTDTDTITELDFPGS